MTLNSVKKNSALVIILCVTVSVEFERPYLLFLHESLIQRGGFWENFLEGEGVHTSAMVFYCTCNCKVRIFSEFAGVLWLLYNVGQSLICQHHKYLMKNRECEIFHFTLTPLIWHSVTAESYDSMIFLLSIFERNLNNCSLNFVLVLQLILSSFMAYGYVITHSSKDEKLRISDSVCILYLN